MDIRVRSKKFDLKEIINKHKQKYKKAPFEEIKKEKNCIKNGKICYVLSGSAELLEYRNDNIISETNVISYYFNSDNPNEVFAMTPFIDKIEFEKLPEKEKEYCFNRGFNDLKRYILKINQEIISLNMILEKEK